MEWSASLGIGSMGTYNRQEHGRQYCKSWSASLTQSGKGVVSLTDTEWEGSGQLH